MSTKFVKTCEMTKEDKRAVSEMTGKIMLWMLEKRSVGYMADKLNIDPWHVEKNIDETLYTLRNQVGRWRYFKMLFIK